MTPEAQRIAIAEACGWEKPFHRNSDKILIGGKFKGTFLIDLPDYLNDLNAMNEAEKVLDEEQADHYQVELANCVEGKIIFDHWSDVGATFTVHATATQRAEAFLRTLGLWK